MASFGGLTAEVRGKVGWPPLPDPSNPEELMGELHARLNHLRSALQDHQFALVDEQTARKAGDEAVRSALRGEIGAVAATTQRVAVGGLWPQVLGWFLVLLGIVVGGAANVVQALTS